jgi:hypothetical protein
MSDELNGQPESPQSPWEPPGADLNFDDLFGGAGDGSSDIIQVAEAPTQTVEPAVPAATEPAEVPVVPASTTPQAPEPTQTTLTQDPKTGEFIRTRTGTVYKSQEDTIRGIEEKDQLIDNLRKMVTAVTGQDPVKKGQTPLQGDVSYLQDANRYAQDKTRAAAYGERTGDWRAYQQVEVKLQREIIEQTVGQYRPVIQKTILQEALDNAVKTTPDFKTFYGTDEYQSVLSQRPALKESIEYWEQNGDPGGKLSQLYQSAWDARNSIKLPELLKQPTSQTPTTPPRMPLGSSTLTAPRVVTERGQASATPGLSTSAGRKALIADMEARGVQDRNF